MALSDLVKKTLLILLLLVLPWASIIAVLAVGFLNIWILLAIVLWIGAGIVFYSVFAPEST
jgi:hypothetical protein